MKATYYFKRSCVSCLVTLKAWNRIKEEFKIIEFSEVELTNNLQAKELLGFIPDRLPVIVLEHKNNKFVLLGSRRLENLRSELERVMHEDL